MESLANLLHINSPQEPPQLNALRAYVKDNHDMDVTVSISATGYYLSVPSAPLASVLQMEIPQIKAACNLDKKLFIRID